MKAMSSLEKCFLTDNIADKEERTEFTVFRNQPFACQIGFWAEGEEINGLIGYKSRYKLKTDGNLKPYATLRRVVNVPSEYPCNETTCDDLYLKREPGLFPDLLQPLHYEDSISLTHRQLHAIWISADFPEDAEAGVYSLTVAVIYPPTGETLCEKTVTVRMLDALLPPQKLIHTEWFYTDCLAEYYHTRAFSEKHWTIIENFLACAAKNGISMILTPIFTPELDTYIGGERLTTQLLDITVTGKNQYEFGFEKVERWIDLCRKVGVRYFEIPHFFTQWGAAHAPKIIATVNGKKKRIFGWETDACGEEYSSFLAQMITALVKFLEDKGVAQNTYFHISDEPHLEHLEQYLRCKKQIEPYLNGLPILDALSDYAFYESGALQTPAPAIKHLRPFLENKVENLWAYYCGDSGVKTIARNVTGRMMAMPLFRTRILGVQLWQHNIKGFLHWGFNFYNNQNSYERIDPFLYTDCEFFAPSGDAFLVYPGDNGQPWDSIRLNALREGMEDMRLLDLCSEKLGRERVEEIITEVAGMEITFNDYPHDTNFLNRLRDRLISEAGL
jgi:hypothetical protein